MKGSAKLLLNSHKTYVLKFRYSEKAKKFEKITCFLVKILKYQNNSYPLFKIEFIFNLICLKIEIDAAY